MRNTHTSEGSFTRWMFEFAFGSRGRPAHQTLQMQAAEKLSVDTDQVQRWLDGSDRMPIGTRSVVLVLVAIEGFVRLLFMPKI